MSEPFIGEIRITGFNFAPVGWALCNGQLISIAQEPALFQLIGTIYGGDGLATFALPDLRGRVPMNAAPGFALGLAGGATQHTLTTPELPAHSHQLMASNANNLSADPTGRVFGAVQPGAMNIFRIPDNSATLAASSVGFSGGAQPHPNMQPYCVMNFIIALNGVFPPSS